MLKKKSEQEGGLTNQSMAMYNMRMHYTYDLDAPKKATTLTVNSDLLRVSKEYKINMSSVFEQALSDEVRRQKTANRLRENKEAIETYNDDVIKKGCFSDGLRAF